MLPKKVFKVSLVDHFISNNMQFQDEIQETRQAKDQCHQNNFSLFQ